ncbi:MAG: tRNA pseudouridine(38-40) synthase TruA [Pseudomonadota bacterium]
MPRYALLIEYDGGPFAGWQRQTGLTTVQGAVEAALARLEPSCPLTAAAGRTDAGVHALGQVATVDLPRDWTAFRLSEALNHHLRPHPVAIRAVSQVLPEFHARFSAVERRYLFRLVTRRAPLALDAGRLWQVKQPLDLPAMQAGARALLGRHDFTTFRSSICQADSPIRTLDRLDITSEETSVGTEYRFDVRARSFLHNQVRSIVGTLERVGAGSWAPQDVGAALDARDRTACGPVCPPQGLYLVGVGYAEDPFT